MTREKVMRDLVLLLSLMGLTALPQAASATVYVVGSDLQLVAASDAVVIGTVLGVVGTIDQSGAIYSDVGIKLEEVLAGTVIGPTVTLHQLGGQAGDLRLHIIGGPTFTPGERVLVCLHSNGDGTVQVQHLGMGKFRLETDPATGVPVLRGQAPPRTLPLSAFLEAVDAAQAAGAFANAPAIVTAPAATGDGSGYVLGQFTLPTPPARWNEADSALPVDYETDATGDATLGFAASEAAAAAGLAAWSAVSSAALSLVKAGTGACADGKHPFDLDGINEICFNDPENQLPDLVGCTGVLGLGGYIATPAGGKTVNGTGFDRIVEAGLAVNNGFGACFDAISLEEVLGHELGHTIGLAHSSETFPEPDTLLAEALMYFIAHLDGRGAALNADDIAGVTFIYPIPVDKAVFNCEKTDAKEIAKFGGGRGKCISKCVKKKVKDPSLDCTGDGAGSGFDAGTQSCVDKTLAKYKAKVAKKCSGHLPDCGGYGSFAPDNADGYSSWNASQQISLIDAVTEPSYMCDASSSDLLKCEQTVVKELSKYASGLIKCLTKCFMRKQLKGEAIDCDPTKSSPPLDSLTKDCMDKARVKAEAKINGKCPVFPGCSAYGGGTSGLLAVVESNVNSKYQDGSVSHPFCAFQ